jgi:hypothetical protein
MFTPGHLDKNLTPQQLRERIAERERERDAAKAEAVRNELDAELRWLRARLAELPSR